MKRHEFNNCAKNIIVMMCHANASGENIEF
jgi:hypothetical protein